jgi:hypothetical protein|tara:strand:- start:7484 stop:7642 length:159 start_codon:yes stop_codon:yes gene_type:complete
MPVHVEKRTGAKPFKVVEPSGKVVGSSETREKAQASANARTASAHGWKPSKK